MVFTFYTRGEAGQKRRFGIAGNSYVAIAEFGQRRVKARSMLVFGQSAHADSPHYLDQMDLYRPAGFKTTWLTLGEIKTHLERAYHPGQEKR